LRFVARQPILPARGHSRGYQGLFRSTPEATAGQGAGLAGALAASLVAARAKPISALKTGAMARRA
jgi:c-di-GMP-related signal transduction protein